MSEQIGSTTQRTQTRLEAVRKTLDDLVERVRNYCAEVKEDPRTLFHVFAYGFGFGNLFSKLRGLKVPPVQSLFSTQTADPTLTAADLLTRWEEIKAHVMELSQHMLGATPMVEAFSKAEETFHALRCRNCYRELPILLVISDGLPTDPADKGSELVLSYADRMQDDGVIIVSSFVTSRNITLNRRLYDSPNPSWPSGARLMFDCSSPISDCPAIVPDLEEHGWHVPAGSRLFAQVNQSELLSEIVGSVVPSQSSELSSSQELTSKPNGGTHIFVSYSHEDAKFVANRDSLLSYLKTLEREGVSFWCDRRLLAGELWDQETRQQIDRADITLVLVSQSFLASKYCTDVEATAFVEARKLRGLRVFPVILSACEWQRVNWLAETQVLPRDSKNVEQHFCRRGQRKALYLEILNELRAQVEEVRKLKARGKADLEQ
jgi:hypothetical protein